MVCSRGKQSDRIQYRPHIKHLKYTCITWSHIVTPPRKRLMFSSFVVFNTMSARYLKIHVGFHNDCRDVLLGSASTIVSCLKYIVLKYIA